MPNSRFGISDEKHCRRIKQQEGRRSVIFFVGQVVCVWTETDKCIRLQDRRRADDRYKSIQHRCLWIIYIAPGTLENVEQHFAQNEKYIYIH